MFSLHNLLLIIILLLIILLIIILLLINYVVIIKIPNLFINIKVAHQDKSALGPVDILILLVVRI